MSFPTEFRVLLAWDHEVVELREENQRLRQELLQVRSLYADECNLNMHLVDVLRVHRIQWR